MATTKKPAAKPATRTKAPPAPRTVHVFQTPVVEILVSAKCVHGCYSFSPSMPTLWNFVGINDGIEVGPASQQPDILIHTHTGDDLEDPCFDVCWTDDEDS